MKPSHIHRLFHAATRRCGDPRMKVGTLAYVTLTLACHGANWAGDAPYNDGTTYFDWDGRLNFYGNEDQTWNSSTPLYFSYNNNGHSTINQNIGWKEVQSIIYESTFSENTPLQGTDGFNLYFKIENYDEGHHTLNVPISVKGTAFEINPINGNLSIGGAITNNDNRSLQVYANNGKTLTLNSALGGSGGITLHQNSTLTLTGNNTYSGATAVNQGTLVVGVVGIGSLGNTTVTVADGAILKGTGTIGGTVEINGSGTYAPGESIGIQTVADLDLNASSIFEWEMNYAGAVRGTNYDAVNVSESLTGAGSVFRIVLPGTTNFSDAFWNTSRTWTDIFMNGDATAVITDWASTFSTLAYYNGSGTISAPNSLTRGSFTISGNPSSGEAALPDEVDILTEMKWEAVVACDQTDNGRVYIDTNPAVNSTTINEQLGGANGVVVRDQNTPDGFGRAYFNHELDAVEFSISRQALLDAGWNGSSKFNYQVFTTRYGTSNSGPNGPGLGDIGGRNDIRDTITDDWLAEDNWSSQANIAANGRLYNWLGADGAGLYPDRRKAAKMIFLTHGHQPVLPGAETQRLINSGFSTGYHRAIDAHEAFAQPLTLHLTPTLATAIQWAAVDPAANKPLSDGPAFNQRLAGRMAAGNIELLGTTFSDHMIGYFSNTYNNDNTALAAEMMQRVYQQTPSSQIFWNPERVADATVFQRIAAMGYSHTFIDQMRHLFVWQGRNTALSDDGYRLNRYHGVTCFAINDQASSYRFQNLDNGFPNPWRNLLHRKARSGTQDQVVVIQNWWEELGNSASAAAYDRNLRWAANKPWIRIVTPEQIANGEIDINRDGSGDPWFVIDRGAPTLPKVSQDWIHHATQENYDNWYLGQPGREEGLLGKVFEIRPGVPLPASRNFGMQTLADGKLADLSWSAVSGLTGNHGSASPLFLARATAHAATLLTAFHNQQNSDLSKYSTGAYTSPDADFNTLADIASRSQSQLRFAAIYTAVESWAASPPATAVALAADVDLDGEDEFILRNDRVFALFEALGGRMTASWARNPANGTVYQVSGNFLAYNDRVTEEEGTTTAFTFDLVLNAGTPNNDADNDDLPDDWEDLYGLSTEDDGSININNGPDGDAEGDGLSNLIEWLVGLNPTIDDRNLYPKLKAERQPDGSVRLEFPIISNRRYRIWHGDDLVNWTAMLPDTDTTGMTADPDFERIDPAPAANQDRRFYRLEIGLPGQ